MSGPVRQPATIAKQKGLYRPSRHEVEKNNVQFECLSIVPEPPEILNEDGKRIWNTTLKSLIQIDGLMTKPDLYLFTELCFTYQLMMECVREMNETGQTITDKKGKVIMSPVWKDYKDLLKIYISLCREFKMSPASRSNMKFEPKKPDFDPLAQFYL